MVDIRECKQCGNEYILSKSKPGLITVCWECAVDVVKLVAEEGTDDTGVVEFMTDNPITIRYIRERLEKEEPLKKAYER